MSIPLSPGHCISGVRKATAGGPPGWGDGWHRQQNSGVVSGFLNHVNTAQQKSDGLAEALAVGDDVNIHEVMLALNDASNAMSMTLQVRSHVLKAYQDLMQIPL